MKGRKWTVATTTVGLTDLKFRLVRGRTSLTRVAWGSADPADQAHRAGAGRACC